MSGERQYKSLKCKCGKVVNNVGERATAVTCEDCVEKGLEDALEVQKSEEGNIYKEDNIIKINKSKNTTTKSTKEVKMKTEQKEAIAAKVLALLDEEGVSVDDKTKVLSFSYNLAKSKQSKK